MRQSISDVLNRRTDKQIGHHEGGERSLKAVFQ